MDRPNLSVIDVGSQGYGGSAVQECRTRHAGTDSLQTGGQILQQDQWRLYTLQWHSIHFFEHGDRLVQSGMPEETISKPLALDMELGNGSLAI